MTLFQQVVNYRRYQEWLQENLLDLGTNTQVFFVGSLAEPTIGVLGETLQILRNFPHSMGRDNLFSRVVAFLSLQSSVSNPLPAEEIFAVCRELGRFSFAGPHKMNTAYGDNLVVYSALFDALFILDDPILGSTPPDKEEGQLLAEAMYTLIHPTSRQIWENVQNDLTDSGQIRHNSHQAVAHGLGIATLYIPAQLVKRYVAARLAYAAIFGELVNHTEGLVCQNMIQPEQPFSTARRFLTSGPYVHPVFRWILDADASSHFDIVPDLDSGFITAFQGQLSHSLVRALNEIPADISHICLSLETLDAHLKQCEVWFKSSKPANMNAPERFAFQYTLTKWQESVLALLKELRTWKQAFFSPEQVGTSASTNLLVSDWRSSRTRSGWRNDFGEDVTSSAPKDISSILNLYRKDAEKKLAAGFNNHIYRSVVSDPAGSLHELESYYADTVRPELSRFTSEPSLSFKRVHDRLEWWVRLAPDQVPQLYLVCWSAHGEITSEPNPRYCFKADQLQGFVDAVFDLAISQTSALEADLTGKWFNQRVRLFADFLYQAKEAFLSYDQDIALLDNNIASRRSYLISHDPTLSRELVGRVFPDTPRSEKNELAGGDPTRFTALSLRLNIPFGAVTALENIKREYIGKSPEKIHVYIQEQVAAVYERRIWNLERTRTLLSPDFVSLLADPQLVTLFCQALFTGTIASSYDESGRQQSWKVSAFDGFAELELAPVGGDGLLTAFRRFVLELPNEQDLNQNPHRNFHPTKRTQYLNLLTKKSKENIAESHAVRDSLKQEFESWRKKGEQDGLARSFSIILQCELDEPVWKGW
ncbi:MAG: hypothetical protein IPG44_17340 [Anaerolineales bacterium]|nr:hypothetical protein [Anaerolineales bacterium]